MTEAANALIGTKVDDTALEHMVAAVRAACDPISDKRGTREYRIKTAGVIARRAASKGTSKGKGKLMAKKVHVTTMVNGDEYEYLAEAGQNAGRCAAQRAGTDRHKEGCSTGDCGACAVLLTVNSYARAWFWLQKLTASR